MGAMIYGKIAEAMKRIGAIGKDSVNTRFIVKVHVFFRGLVIHRSIPCKGGDHCGEDLHAYLRQFFILSIL